MVLKDSSKCESNIYITIWHWKQFDVHASEAENNADIPKIYINFLSFLSRRSSKFSRFISFCLSFLYFYRDLRGFWNSGLATSNSAASLGPTCWWHHRLWRQRVTGRMNCYALLLSCCWYSLYACFMQFLHSSKCLHILQFQIRAKSSFQLQRYACE